MEERPGEAGFTGVLLCCCVAALPLLCVVAMCCCYSGATLSPTCHVGEDLCPKTREASSGRPSKYRAKLGIMSHCRSFTGPYSSSPSSSFVGVVVAVALSVQWMMISCFSRWLLLFFLAAVLLGPRQDKASAP